MLAGIQTFVEEDVARAVTAVDWEEIANLYQEQGEFWTTSPFFSSTVVTRFVREVENVRPYVNRNYIPFHKKGGSVSFYLLKRYAPAILSLYRASQFIAFLSHVARVPLQLCPEDDPHSCALYFYTEPGDHIGFHYDTSYYNGNRYTVLVGLLDHSSSRLVCRLHTKEPARESRELSLTTDPGSIVFFNGDLLYHAVTPLGPGEERVVLTLQYVTDPTMRIYKRWFSNMKDAVGYFGLPALWRKGEP
ncbi:MAG: 2OG-Fe(II) oxygenase [Nitrospirae bacterium]|nr:MAG: 2OG-Fe(II) oxygenase [Nitrospirota bacterium]